MNDNNITFEERNEAETVDSGIIFTIFDIMDGCADNDIDRAMQIQLSRVAIHNLEKHGFNAEKISELTAKSIDQYKLKFIFTGEKNKDQYLTAIPLKIKSTPRQKTNQKY